MDYPFAFRGRMSRGSYLVIFLVTTILAAVFVPLSYPMLMQDTAMSTKVIVAVVYLALLVHVLSTSVRRLHDLGQSGWMSLLFLIPVINVMLLGHLFFGKSDRGPNIYGEEPL